jgi:hypothetical protein
MKEIAFLFLKRSLDFARDDRITKLSSLGIVVLRLCEQIKDGV